DWNALRPVRTDAWSRNPGRKGRGRGAAATAPLNRLVRNDPRVPAAAHAAGRPPPAADVRLVLVGDPKGQPLQPGFAERSEVEDELVTVVQEPVAVDRLVVPDRQVAGQSRRASSR